MTERLERAGLVSLLFIFACATWRGLTFFFSGDDMMNMYWAWNVNASRLARSLIEIWVPLYRPLGAAVYRVFFATFGFHPLPLYIFCWTLLLLNVVLAWRFLRTVAPAPFEALTALALVLVHGSFLDLYLSAGTIYDRLWFLFTVLGLTLYARMRSMAGGALICLICILSMDSKESGVALPLLMAIYECVFILPGREWRTRLRKIAPLYGVLAVLSLLFVFLRVHRTPELAGNGAYAPQASVAIWLTRVAEYFTILVYKHVIFTRVTTAFVMAVMAALAALLRNRAMIFGWLFFVVTITPVALIASRPGYVLYVPDLGLGMYFAALLWRVSGARLPALQFAFVTAAVCWFHIHNWPDRIDPTDSPEMRLTEQFRRDFPKLPKGAKLLFVSDGFPRPAYDLLFNLRMMYGDRTIHVDRVEAPPDQQPNPKNPLTYDHVLQWEAGHYAELDNRDVAASERLHILKDYTVGREMNVMSRDHSAYFVSGVTDGDGEVGLWTAPQASLKFDLYPAPAVFSAKFWVPDFIAKSGTRVLRVMVGGRPVGDYPLNHDGMNELSFSVPADSITNSGFTIVDLNVENPYKDSSGNVFGVVLLRAGFTWQNKR